MMSRALALRDPIIVDAHPVGEPGTEEVLAWDFAWQLPPTQGGYVVTCRHRHPTAPKASVCPDLEPVAGNGLGWVPLGVRPSP